MFLCCGMWRALGQIHQSKLNLTWETFYIHFICLISHSLKKSRVNSETCTSMPLYAFWVQVIVRPSVVKSHLLTHSCLKHFDLLWLWLSGYITATCSGPQRLSVLHSQSPSRVWLTHFIALVTVKKMCHSPCKAFLLMISALHHAAGLQHKSSKGNWKELKPDCWVTFATRNLMGLITFQALS